MGRILIFTGKGGVGKTSVAAAHAVKSAAEGKNTLLVSADMAHNLGDIFRTEVGSTPTTVREHLDLLELDPDRIMQEEFPQVTQALSALFVGSGLSGLDADDPMPIPGFETLFSLLKIKAIYESGRYERILVDCAPTGETLSLLKLPELLAWYMEKFFPVGKTMVRVMAPFAKARYQVSLPSRTAMDEMEQLHQTLMALQQLLKDEQVCSVRLVCIPEKMVVEETKRNYMYLNLYRYQVDGVYINRILPEETGNPFLQNWRTIQSGYLTELEQVFAGVPIARIPWYSREVRGMDAVERLCRDVLTAEDLFALRRHTESEYYEPTDDGYCLVLSLPGADSDHLKVYHREMDVEVKLNNFSRCIPLPNVLRGSTLQETSIEDGTVRLRFRMKQTEAEGGAAE